MIEISRGGRIVYLRRARSKNIKVFAWIFSRIKAKTFRMKSSNQFDKSISERKKKIQSRGRFTQWESVAPEVLSRGECEDRHKSSLRVIASTDDNQFDWRCFHYGETVLWSKKKHFAKYFELYFTIHHQWLMRYRRRTKGYKGWERVREWEKKPERERDTMEEDWVRS